MSTIQWLRDNYGWEAKRTVYTWLAVLAVLFIALATVGPVIFGWFE